MRDDDESAIPPVPALSNGRYVALASFTVYTVYFASHHVIGTINTRVYFASILGIGTINTRVYSAMHLGPHPE